MRASADRGEVPLTNRLLPNHPNPFRTDTMIRFELAQRQAVRIEVYDSQGRLVRSLVDGSHEPGRYEVRWDGVDMRGRDAAAGIYFIRSTTSAGNETRRTEAMMANRRSRRIMRDPPLCGVDQWRQRPDRGPSRKGFGNKFSTARPLLMQSNWASKQVRGPRSTPSAACWPW